MTSKISINDLQNVFFAITNICNCRCITCDIGTSNRDKQNPDSLFLDNLHFSAKEYASAELMQRIFDELRVIAPQLYITGGEPLISPKFSRFLEIFRNYSGRIDLVTNGTFLQEYSERIANSSIASVNVSLDGFQDTHDTIRGVSGLYERVIKGITELKERQKEGKARQELNLNFTISRSNYEAIFSFAERAYELGVNRVDFLHPQYVSPRMAQAHNERYPEMHVGTRMYDKPSTYDLPLSDLLRMMDKTKMHFGSFVAFFPNLTPEQMKVYYEDDLGFPFEKRCSAPFKGFEIIQNGDCIIGTPCVPYRLGNIMQDSLDDIWLGEPMEKFRTLLQKDKRFPICSRCCAYYYE